MDNNNDDDDDKNNSHDDNNSMNNDDDDNGNYNETTLKVTDDNNNIFFYNFFRYYIKEGDKAVDEVRQFTNGQHELVNIRAQEHQRKKKNEISILPIKSSSGVCRVGGMLH